MSNEPAIEIQERERSLRDILHILFRHEGKIVVFFSVVMALTLLAAVFMQNIYRSEAQLMLRLGRENLALDPTVTVGQTVGITQTRENELLSELRILESRELKEEIIDRLGVGAFTKSAAEGGKSHGVMTALNMVETLTPREKAVVKLEKGLDIQVLEDSAILSIAFEHADKEFAQQVVTALVELYQEKHIAVHRTEGSYEFFEAQALALKQRLGELDEQLRTLKTAAGVSSLPDQRVVLTNRLDRVEQQRAEVEAALAVSQARVTALQKIVEDTPQQLVLEEATGFNNPAAAAMREQVYLLKLREKELTSKYEETSLPVQAIREQIAKAEQLLSGEEPVLSHVTRGINNAHSQLLIQLHEENARLASLQAQQQAVIAQQQKVRELLDSTNQNDMSIGRLERERAICETNYRRYAQNMEDARIDDALEEEKISNVRVIQAASAPLDPVGPKKRRNLLLGLALAVLGSIGLALVFEYVDHTLKTPEDVHKHLSLPVLASVPRTHKNQISETKERVPIRGNGKVSHKKERGWRIPFKLRERFADLRESLLLNTSDIDGRGRILAIAGTQRGEGGTTVAVNLAASMANRTQGKVLLVDLNTDEPSLQRVFKHEPTSGWSDDLADKSDGFTSIRSAPIANLEYLPVGNAAESLEINWDEVRDKIGNLARGYQCVVLDLPPVNEASGSLGLAGLGDALTLVVETERARWEVAHRALERLELGGARLAGVVLNKRRFPIPQWLYRWL
ncbi:MAG: polysaccharide biosynthesis tyrosine autokinase [Planctomycetota bacterium]